MKKSSYIKMACFALFLPLLFTGCEAYSQIGSATGATDQTVSQVTYHGDKQLEKAADTAVFIRKNIDKKLVTLQSTENGQKYDLTYTGTTEVFDRYGQSLTMDQVELGEIVDVIISMHSQTLDSLTISGEAFTLTDVEKHDMNLNRNLFSIRKDNYKVTEDVVIVNDDMIGEPIDLNEDDILTVKGIGRQIYSIAIEKGHGYVRLTGDEYFVGGWIEIGQRIIRPITDNMLVLVPEGEYDMLVTYNGFGGEKPIEVKRDEETIVDISDLKGELLKMGKLSFLVDPSFATVKINGEVIDTNVPKELEYGVYRLQVEAPGYQGISKYVSVGQEMASLEITLEEEKDSSSSSSSSKRSSSASSNRASSSSKREGIGSGIGTVFGKTSSSSSTGGFLTDIGDIVDGANYLNQAESTDTSTGQLYIDGPEEVEVYYDGVYKGIAPINFAKTAGTHIITLRRDGYVTKSYTVTLDSAKENESYSFNGLVEDDE